MHSRTLHFSGASLKFNLASFNFLNSFAAKVADSVMARSSSMMVLLSACMLLLLLQRWEAINRQSLIRIKNSGCDLKSPASFAGMKQYISTGLPGTNWDFAPKRDSIVRRVR